MWPTQNPQIAPNSVVHVSTATRSVTRSDSVTTSCTTIVHGTRPFHNRNPGTGHSTHIASAPLESSELAMSLSSSQPSDEPRTQQAGTGKQKTAVPWNGNVEPVCGKHTQHSTIRDC